MNRSFLLLAGALALAGVCSAQEPMIAEGKAAYDAIKNNILKSAEKMPEEAYGFAPVKEERTWAALMGHIADAQTRICGMAAGEMKKANSSALTAKADLVKALKASNESCDAVWAATTPENAQHMAKMFGRDLTRLSVLIYNTTHDNESYGTMAVYMRLKGIVPPSSEK